MFLAIADVFIQSEEMTMADKTLPPRAEIVGPALDVAARFQLGIQRNGENTVLKQLGFGGLTGWFNQNYFFEHPRSFAFAEGINLREVLDQAYAAC